MTIYLNAFQKWAFAFAPRFGFRVTTRGNWVTLAKGSMEFDCMTYDAVRRTVERLAA